MYSHSRCRDFRRGKGKQGNLRQRHRPSLKDLPARLKKNSKAPTAGLKSPPARLKRTYEQTT
ncbi:hypothetical protein HMPREF1981_03546, partial [Bacteroides pyogenes F0041]